MAALWFLAGLLVGVIGTIGVLYWIGTRPYGMLMLPKERQ